MCQRILELIEVCIRQADKSYADQKVDCHDDGRCKQSQIEPGSKGQNDKDADSHYKAQLVGIPEEVLEVSGCVNCLCWRESGQSIQCGAPGAMRMHVADADAFTGKFLDHAAGVFLVREQEIQSSAHKKSRITFLNKGLKIPLQALHRGAQPSALAVIYSCYSPVGNPVVLDVFPLGDKGANSLSVVDT